MSGYHNQIDFTRPCGCNTGRSRRTEQYYAQAHVCRKRQALTLSVPNHDGSLSSFVIGGEGSLTSLATTIPTPGTITLAIAITN
jgi:hypothetical protein